MITKYDMVNIRDFSRPEMGPNIGPFPIKK